jgi:hypothetical protein
MFTASFLLMTMSAFAQDVKVGFRTGATSFKVNHDLFEDKRDYVVGLDLAIPVEISLNKYFSIQPELHFTQKGVAFDDLEEGIDQRLEFKTNYLELPVLLKAKYGTEKLKLYAFVAPSIGYATNRFVTEQIGDGDKEKEGIGFITDGPVQDQRWEFSAIGGLGVELKAGVGSLVLDTRYSLGLTDGDKFLEDRPADWQKSFNRGCTFSIGYMIPLGEK